MLDHVNDHCQSKIQVLNIIHFVWAGDKAIPMLMNLMKCKLISLSVPAEILLAKLKEVEALILINSRTIILLLAAKGVLRL